MDSEVRALPSVGGQRAPRRKSEEEDTGPFFFLPACLLELGRLMSPGLAL